jgi:hypothetical protein
MEGQSMELLMIMCPLRKKQHSKPRMSLPESGLVAVYAPPAKASEVDHVQLALVVLHLIASQGPLQGAQLLQLLLQSLWVLLLLSP